MDGLFNFYMLRDLGYFILDLLGILAIPLLFAAIYRLLRPANTERIKMYYEERIKVLQEQIKDLKNSLKLKESQFKEELRSYHRQSKMILGIKNALSKGSIQIKCRQHMADVEVLADGTIICGAGKHRIWPPEEEVERHEFEERIEG
jgi:hypothetical protein